MTELRPRGYVIPAIDSKLTSYTECARRLRDSILRFHPQADVTIVTADMLPFGDQGGQANDWQMYHVSPYHETIKLEADMIMASDCDHWWYMMRNRDMVISVGCRDYLDRSGVSRYYRKIFDQNNLPDVYNAITYWRVSDTAREFFQWCRDIWNDWPRWRTVLKFSQPEPDTDLVYAMVSVIMGVERTTLPVDLAPRIVHMKSRMIGTQHEDWTQECVWELHNDWLRINTVSQWGAVHYLRKDWQP